ncbi:hypothetical protein [Actinomyces howellii]|uniref:Antitoxin VbhA domain-containing protein n=1 Tax=Actinomyces howellii TaxID=52771 RepID=A0A3S4RWJ5_9ACTO|nr:hypothetical protein [Actinomyces howellii]VEG28094.1 Uncharacterised protein [Actinomyces howellii]
MASTPVMGTPEEAEARERVAFADAALALAGHEVTDPYLNKLAALQARGDLSADEARRLGRRYLIGR